MAYISILVCILLCFSGVAKAQGCAKDSTRCCKKSRLSLGGYGEAVMSRMFYSDNISRCSKAGKYKNAKGRRQADLPHVAVMLGYDFGKDWAMNSEIEFEHGSTESAMEVGDKEFGEWEGKIERGGEVTFERFWIQKSFYPELDIHAGHDMVPIEYINAHHPPTEFFTVYRPEEENQILPCTWCQTGVLVWGRWKFLRYQAIFLLGLNSPLFSKDQWIKNRSTSALKLTPANKYVIAVRLDFYPLKGLHIGLSGYYGGPLNNALQSGEHGRYKDVKGAVAIGAIDMDYTDHDWCILGGFDYRHLGSTDIISTYNRSQSPTLPYKRTLAGNRAYAASIRVGYNVMRFFPYMRSEKQQPFVFGTYESYDAYHPATGNSDYEWIDRDRVASGFNYHPTKQIVVKGKYSNHSLESRFNNEPNISLDIAYIGSFLQFLRYNSNNKKQKR